MNDFGTASIEPRFGRVGSLGTWVLTYVAGDRGLSSGGTLRIQLPNSWNTGPRNLAKGVQSEDSRAPNYVSARTGASASLSCVVDQGSTDEVVMTNRSGLDGNVNRYVYVVGVEVLDGSVNPGESVDVVFGDTAFGSRGFAAGYHPQGAEPVGIEVRSGSDAQAVILRAEVAPTLELLHDEPVELLAVAPSTLVVGEMAVLRVSLLDRFGNPTTSSTGLVHAFVTSGDVELPEQWIECENGRFQVPFKPRSPGVVRIKLGSTAGLTATSNPVEVLENPPRERLYWGDLHSHAELSFDGLGNSPGVYARDVAALDFFSRTEHCEHWTGDEFERVKAEVRSLYDPGTFVTLLAYEATFGDPWGHHNVYFRGLEGPISGDHTGTLEDLWQVLEAGEAFTIPHHTGVRWNPIARAGDVPGSMSPNPDWQYHDPELRPLIEIYSLHGQCEEYSLDHPLAYEAMNFSVSTSNPGPFYARDAWSRGLRLGVVASSDNHRAQPGRGEGGLAAVWATDLTREAVFDSLLSRHTYGTSGARMILRFSVDGSGPGEIVPASEQHSISIRAHGTGEIASIELFVGDLGVGEIRRCASWTPSALDFEQTWIDDDPPAEGLYYVRVKQAKPYRHRAVMAWSSPVWVHTPSEA